MNFAVARVLLAAGRKYRSIALEADARHLMTDVWTSGGVLVGVGLVAVSGWQRLDPIVAILVALNIVWSGVSLLRRSATGLLDPSLPDEERRVIEAVLERHQRDSGIVHHALRTRQAASHRFVSVHILVPGSWTVKQGHDVVDAIEVEISAALANVTVTTHLEPVEDAKAYGDSALHR